jgi:hypothetical protein
MKAGQKDQAARLLKELRRQSETGFVTPEFMRNFSKNLRPTQSASAGKRTDHLTMDDPEHLLSYKNLTRTSCKTASSSAKY